MDQQIKCNFINELKFAENSNDFIKYFVKVIFKNIFLLLIIQTFKFIEVETQAH